MGRVLHLLSQRPGLTGSGITLDALVRCAQRAGWDQEVVVGVPAGDPLPDIGGLPGDRITTLSFGSSGGALEFPVPGMSDVMPYESTRFSLMTRGQIARYLAAWRSLLAPLLSRFKPDLIHSHHIWLLSSLLKDLAPDLPVVTHCHATGLRQLELCPQLAEQVRRGCARNNRFLVLHEGHAEALRRQLGVPESSIEVVGAGYRADLFHARDAGSASAAAAASMSDLLHARDAGSASAAAAASMSDLLHARDAGTRLRERILYAGKYSSAKGLPWLLDAFEKLRVRRPNAELHIAGSGAGPEADQLHARMMQLSPAVVLHGQTSPSRLAGLMRSSALLVLPSLYEGVPLVLVEATACGCRLVATALPGVVDQLEPRLGPALDLVQLPPMTSIDKADPRGLPVFVNELERAMDRALAKPWLGDPAQSMPGALHPFSFDAVFSRIERSWTLVMGEADTL